MGKTFKSLRIDAGLSRLDLAHQLNLKEDTIKKYERSYRLPSEKKLLEMQVIFRCSFEEIIDAYTYHKKDKIEKSK